MTISKFPTFLDLNRDPAVWDILRSVSRPGLVLISGSTGQGKSTTLAALGTEFQRDGLKVFSVRTEHDAVLPGVPEIVKENFGSSMVRAVLGVHQPDVVLIDSFSFQDSYKFAVDLAAKDALVIASVHAGSPEYAVQRMVDAYPNDDGANAVATAMIMSIHQKIVPADENEFNADHWAAVSKAENLMSMANPSYPPFAYRDDRKVEMTFKTYIDVPTASVKA